MERDFTLKDGRACHIRLVNSDDAEEILRYIPQVDSESDNMARFPGEFSFSLEQERQFIIDQKHDGAMILAAIVDNTMVGLAGAMLQKQRRYQHHAELGMSTLKAYWGLGIGRQVLRAVVDWGQQAKLTKMYLRVHDFNKRAITLYESEGFAEEARLKDFLTTREGTLADCVVMSKYYNR